MVMKKLHSVLRYINENTVLRKRDIKIKLYSKSEIDYSAQLQASHFMSKLIYIGR